MQIKLNNTMVEIITQRSTRARKSLDMEFTASDQLLIILPTAKDINLKDILQKNKTMLERKHREYLKRVRILEHDKILINGEPRTLIIQPKQPKKVELTQNKLTIHTNRQRPEPILKQWMTQQTQTKIEEIQQKYKLEPPKHLEIVDTARWGYVKKQTIHINNQLIALPLPLQEFITVHEHLHLQHMNHGPTFQTKLREKIPNYPTREYELKKYLALDFNKEITQQ